MTHVRLLIALFMIVTSHAYAADHLVINPMAFSQSAVVFMYHHFGQNEFSSTNVRLTQFEQHLDLLEKDHYQVWPLAKIIEYLHSKQPLPDKTIAITVDDAYLSVYTEAYPRLKARGWPFTVFVSTDVIDQRLPAYMSWDQMRKMQQHRVTFANHSASHDHLIMMHKGETLQEWEQRITADIERAQTRLKKELGHAPQLFAYPYGEYNRVLANVISRLGFAGFGQQSGAIGPGSDMRALPRYPMSEEYADIENFKTKAESMALPVINVTPWDPQLHEDLQPVMDITLAPSDARLGQLACYVSKQGRGDVQWLEKNRRFTVTARQPLPAGRSRYNCTAPSAQPGRYYWFSHLWIR